jgi:histone H3/H4
VENSVILETFKNEFAHNRCMSKKTLPLAAMERLLKNGGADRVADKAKEVFRDYLEEHANKISTEASRLAIHSGRKTVKSEDVKLAARNK